MKYAHFIAFKESYNAEKLGHLVLDQLVQYHRILKSFTTDRDKLFTSNFWKTLVAAIGIQHKLSTAYHPETDGQTERTNQTLETYLQHYVNHAQNNWVSLLPMAQLALNNGQNETTKTTLHFDNFSKHLNLFHKPLQHPQADKAMIQAEKLKDLHSHLCKRIVKMHEQTTPRINARRKMALQLKEGDKVYLLMKNLKTQQKLKKLDHIKVRPFLIAEAKGPVNY